MHKRNTICTHQRVYGRVITAEWAGERVGDSAEGNVDERGNLSPS